MKSNPIIELMKLIPMVYLTLPQKLIDFCPTSFNGGSGSVILRELLRRITFCISSNDDNLSGTRTMKSDLAVLIEKANIKEAKTGIKLHVECRDVVWKLSNCGRRCA